MGRELKRVPLDFDYMKNRVWYGYYLSLSTCVGGNGEHCEQCKKMAQVKNIPMTDYGCPDWDIFLEEPIKKIERTFRSAERRRLSVMGNNFRGKSNIASV